MSDPFAALDELIGGAESPPIDVPPASDTGPKFSDPLGFSSKRERRPRAPRASSEPKAPKVKADVKTLTTQLVGIHLLIAKVSGHPAMELSADEASMLAKSIADILEEYSLQTSGKTMLWINLIAAVAIIYLPRLMLIKMSRKAPKPTEVPPSQTPKPAPRSGAMGVMNWNGLA